MNIPATGESHAIPPNPVATAILTGHTLGHLCADPDAALLGGRVHRDVVAPLVELRRAAADAGFDLRVLSGFRSFEHQLSIWNRKATGSLTVLDSEARPIDITTLDYRDLVFAILRWSALPGASRHHWGTDVDVYDRAAQPEGYEVALVPEEVESGGMFGPLHDWLDRRMDAGAACGFYRPYDRDRGGVAPERWHLSYAPIAVPYARQLTPSLVRAAVTSANMELGETVLSHLDEIHERFVANVNPGA